MTKITTQTCIDFLDANQEDERVEDFYDRGNSPWRRGSKFKTKSKETVREFYRQDRSFDKIYVREDHQGNLHIEEFRPDEMWLFSFDDCQEDVEEGMCGFFITPKSYYDENGHGDDRHIMDRVEHLLPPGSDETCEAMFECPGTQEYVRSYLVANGMTEIKF